MRLLLALLFVSSQCYAKSLEDGTIQFSTESHPNYYEEVNGAPLHVRVKRSIFAALGFTSQCEAGWTGQFCENPICSGNTTSFSVPSRNMLVDHLYLPTGCPGKYYIPVDSLSMGLNIRVYASGLPYINLTDVNGNVVQGSGGAVDSIGYMVYPATLPPGGYQLTIDNGGVAGKDCTVEIETLSYLGAVTGFSMSPQSDILPNWESGIDNTPMYFVTHVVNVTGPGQVRSVTIRSDKSMDPAYRSVLTPRYSCVYEYYAGQFSCSKSSQYVVHVDGVDTNGYPFRRSRTFSCLEPISTTPAPTTPSLNTCYNGGTMMNYNQPTAYCFCPELFTGRQCEKPACMNGGSLLPSGVQCDCPDGYWGINCEHVNCEPNVGQYLTDDKSLVIVVRDTVSMTQYIPNIVAAVQAELIDNSAVEDGIYKNFMLVRFADGVFLPKLYQQEQYQKFIDDLKSVGNSKTVGNCSDVTFDAIADVFTQMIYEKSPIFLFTDAVASDVDNWRSVTESNSRRKLPIYSFFFAQSSCNFDEMNPGYDRAIKKAVLYSGGLAFLVNDPSKLTTFFTTTMRGTTSRMNQVYANDLDRCVVNVQRSFMIDSSAQDIIIMATGNNLIASFTDPSWNTNVQLLVSQDGPNYIFEIPGVQRGEYLFSISTSDPQAPCSIRINARSDYDLFFGTSIAPYLEAVDTEPVVGQPVHFVAQLNGLVNATQDPYRLFSELTITTNKNNADIAGKPMYYSNGVYRDGCGYHLYFGVANFCEFADQPFYATVFADDNQGFTIQRTTIGYCSLALTTVTPPGACQNGGVLDPSKNTTCVCPVGFTGDFCHQIICQNGGTPAGSFCICNAGSLGTFCELYTCPLMNPQPDGSFEGQTMVFVVAARPSMQSVWTDLAANVGDFVRNAQDHSATWIKKWVLVTINGDGPDLIVEDQNGQKFVEAVIGVAGNLSQYSAAYDDTCNVTILDGLLYGTYKSERRSSIYLFTDTSGLDGLQFSKLFTHVTEYQLTINMIQTNSMPTCTSDGNLPDYIQDIAYMSNGFVYATNNIKQMLPYITSFYKSGVSGMVFGNDCSGDGVVGYVGIDGWTQSFTIATTGDSITSVEVTLPDGSPALNSLYEIDLISGSQLNLKQFISRCPSGPGWYYNDQYCYTFRTLKMSWYNSSLYCHEMGAALADVLNEDKDQYLHKQTGGMANWIGLTRMGDQWFWDIPNGNHFQPLDPSYTKWCPNFPVPDTDKNCVIMAKDPTGCWQNVNCKDDYVFVCQLHRYGQGYYPGQSTNNVVPGGKWKIKVKSDSGACFAQVRSQSEIQVFFGFVQEPHDDFPTLWANSESNTNYIIANPTSLVPFQPDGEFQTLEGNLNYAVMGFNNTISNALTVSNRWFCGYPYISQSFSCPQTGAFTDFFIQFSGIDQYGYSFDRIADANCYKYNPRCDNGGFVVNGQCICQPGYTGSQCSTPICINGQDVNGQCQCDPMFTGPFCDIPFCEPKVPATFGDTGKTLAILLETSYNMGATIFQMKKNIQNALNSINNDPTTAGWFSNYILYPFDSTSNKNSWYPVVKTESVNELVDAVKSIPTMTCPGNGTCSTSCPRPIMGVLRDVLSMDEFASPNSIVLVISRSSPEDYTLMNGDMTKLLQQSRAQINFLLPAIDSPCSEGWSSPDVISMYRTVQYSDGNLFVMSAVDVSTSFMTKYIPTLYKSAGLESASLPTCGNSEILFQVEHEMYEFTIDYYMPLTDPPFVITLTDPAGDQLTLPPSIILSDSNYLGVVQVNDTGATRAGTYKLSITGGASNYCYLNIRGRSSIEIYPGFVKSNDGYNGAITDAAHYAPVYDELNTIVVHAEGLGNGVLTYAQIVVGSYGLVHTTYLLPRDTTPGTGCTYTWYGNLPFNCDHEDLLMVIYGQDERGAIFRRNYVVSAVDSRPMPLPPPATCDYNSKKTDLLFMIDSSLQDSSDQIFKQLKAFAANTVISNKIGANFSQVAALTVADQGYQGFNYNDGTSWTVINNLFTNLTYSGKAGQNTASGFQMVIDSYENPAQGYRNDARNLLIYLTATNPTDSDPLLLPGVIRRQGIYGVAVIAYKVTPDNNMKGLVDEGCIYSFNNPQDLNHYGTNFIQQLICARMTPCRM